MRFTSLQQLESTFQNTGNGGEYILKKIAVPVPGEDLTLQGMFCTPVRRSGYFHSVAHSKERVLIHFTAGQIRSDMSALTRQDFHVSVPFVIGRNGTIYQLYSSKFWSGNIGKGLGNAGNAEDKKTIAIEISNYGFVIERDGNLETIYSRLKDKQGRTGPVDVYCSLSDTAAYQKLATPFRGQSYYPTYTDEQYESLIILLRYLTATYNIPRQFLPESKRYVATNDVLSFRGIVTHVNYRESGKWDIGPAFDWASVIQGVQAATFTPSIPVNRDVVDGDVIRSEEELEDLLPKDKGLEPQEKELLDLDDSRAIESEKEEKNLYALIVGINDYRADIVLEDRVTFPKLRGCVRDAEKIKSYLESLSGFTPHIECLSDKKAAKEAIVNAFNQHLGQAQKGDTVLFYYSGHGTQENADAEAWASDSDGRLECLACYYDESTKDKFLLADKELRFLIKQLSDKGAHMVALFDCCHSGDNTRNGAFVRAAFDEVVEKRIPFSFKQRPWEDFIFSNNLSREDVIKKGDAAALPEGLHVQFSACESDESAVEVRGEGVFTKALIGTLQAANGDVTYQALRNRIRQYLRNIYEQKPRIYVVNGDQALLYSTFLNGRSGDRSLAYGDVLYNGDTGWQLSLGAIHGIGETTKTIKVIDPEDGNKEYSAAITQIKADISLLDLGEDTALDTGKVYKGYVENLLTKAIRILLNNVDGLPETQQGLLDAVTTAGNKFIRLDEADPQYVVHNSNGQLYITLPGDDYRPLIQPVDALPEAVPVVTAYLKQMAQWSHLRSLANKGGDGNLTGDEIEVTIRKVKGTNKEQIPVTNGTALIEFEKDKDKWRVSLEFELKNTTDTPLYCCVLYLTSTFGAYNNLLPQLVQYLEPGQSVKLQYNGKAALPFSLNEEIKWYNWAAQTEYLKLIVNTEEFDAASLSLEPLPAPAIPGKTRGMVMKGLVTEQDTEGLSGWGTQIITLQQPNPEYNVLDEVRVQQMVDDPDTTQFALGLYFDVSVGENMQPVYKLKSSLQADRGEKSMVTDVMLNLANKWARRKRNRLYKDIANKFPDRIRVVSEGDSWFQHPLVLDVIDHLSRTYAVYCTAAAGDTIRNMKSGDKSNGDYYLNAIDTIKPDFFLISGGGNDILGSQFRGYLQDKFDTAIEEGKDPERFLRGEIFKEITSLADIYRSVFSDLKQSHPDMQIIVHGYDYPVKLDDAKKGWLGRYMIEKGISRAGDRQAIIHRIMDEFNDQLEKVAKEFDNVSYLNLRGLVRYQPVDGVDQWYDEIHPNDEGFQQIAMKYIQKISEKVKRR